MTENELIRSVPCVSWRIGPNTILLAKEGDSKQELAPVFLGSLIKSCVNFKTAHHHARDFWRKTSKLHRFTLYNQIFNFYLSLSDQIILSPFMFEGMLTEIIKNYSLKGYFLTPSQWFGQNDTATANEISSVGIVTRDRVGGLKTCLESFISNNKEYSRSLRYIIFDDSMDEKVRRQYRSSIAELRSKWKVPVSYAGLEEKKSFSKKIISLGIPEKLILFALFGYPKLGLTYGANRNAFLLETAGELAFSLDDDTLCQVAPSPTTSRVVKLFSEKYPFEFLYFNNRKESFAGVTLGNHDILGEHQKTLGKNLHSILRNHSPEEINFEEAPPPVIKDIFSVKKSHVIMSFNGLVGDCGSNAGRAGILADQNIHKKMFESESQYRDLLQNREVVKFTSQTSFAPSSPCMTTFFGLDNRHILPPFFPLFRMEDALFGEMLRISNTHSMFSYIPWILVHAPEIRQNDLENNQLDNSIWPHEVISIALRSFFYVSPSDDTSKTLEKMGLFLSDFFSQPWLDLREFLVNYLREKQAKQLYAFSTLLGKFPKAPAYWKQDMRNLIENMKSGISDEIHLVFGSKKIPSNELPNEQMIQSILKDFSELIIWWPKIVESAISLKESGTTLSELLNQ